MGDVGLIFPFIFPFFPVCACVHRLTIGKKDVAEAFKKYYGKVFYVSGIFVAVLSLILIFAFNIVFVVNPFLLMFSGLTLTVPPLVAFLFRRREIIGKNFLLFLLTSMYTLGTIIMPIFSLGSSILVHRQINIIISIYYVVSIYVLTPLMHITYKSLTILRGVTTS
ncbi:MAG: hypothetical protein ACTSYM_01045 [Candidatus Baldrarchaeia archaeon]